MWPNHSTLPDQGKALCTQINFAKDFNGYKHGLSMGLNIKFIFLKLLIDLNPYQQEAVREYNVFHEERDGLAHRRHLFG